MKLLGCFFFFCLIIIVIYICHYIYCFKYYLFWYCINLQNVHFFFPLSGREG